MNLIDEIQAEALYGEMGPGREVSGGSAGNTAAGIASLGGACGFIGKVHNDELGKVFSHDMRAAGVAFDTAHLAAGPATARLSDSGDTGRRAHHEHVLGRLR